MALIVIIPMLMIVIVVMPMIVMVMVAEEMKVEMAASPAKSRNQHPDPHCQDKQG